MKLKGIEGGFVYMVSVLECPKCKHVENIQTGSDEEYCMTPEEEDHNG
jgi:phage FluMu protein Com